jgi:1,4-dihydroxy-2-naphthoate octaprenyltransferase
VLKGGTDVDWTAIAQNLRTEVIIGHVQAVDPLSLTTNPYVVVPAVLLLGVMIVLKMVRTLATIVGVIALWLAVIYTLPAPGLEIKLTDLGAFSGACIGVAALLIYVYFVRE